MKTKLLGLSLAALATAAAFAQARQKSAPPPSRLRPAQRAMMDAFEKAGAIGPNHEQLQSLVGEWSYAMKAWTNPAGPPEEGNGSTTYRSLMGGRYVQHEHKGTFRGHQYHGIGLFGYDNVTKRFQGHFFENVKTGQLLMNGIYDAATKTYTFRGEMDDVVRPETKVKVRETVRVPDANTHVLEWYETRGGKEQKTMEVTYKRK